MAIYTVNAREPGALLNANSVGTAVTTGWCSISIPSTQVVAGTTYWLGFISEGTCVGYVYSGSNLRYKPATYSGFSFHNPAGTGFTSSPSVYYLLAGWGTPPAAPCAAPAPLSPGTVIIFK